jgi:hypothetical protein
MNNIICYTCITNNKDKSIKQNWPITRFIDSYDKFKDPRRNSRIQKIMPHKYFDSEYTIYIDGNRKLLMSPEEIVKRYMDGYDMAIFKHALRDCIYDEALEVARLKLDDQELIIEQAKHYEDQGFAKHKGLCEAGFIVRRNTEKVNNFNEYWWADYCRFSRRDQLSLMPALDKAGLVVNVLTDNYDIQPDGTAVRGGIITIEPHQHFEGNFNDPNIQR